MAWAMLDNVRSSLDTAARARPEINAVVSRFLSRNTREIDTAFAPIDSVPGNGPYLTWNGEETILAVRIAGTWVDRLDTGLALRPQPTYWMSL